MISDNAVMCEVAAENGWTVKEMLAMRRTKKLVAARKKIAIRLREQGYSRQRIANMLGVNYTTIINYTIPHIKEHRYAYRDRWKERKRVAYRASDNAVDSAVSRKD